MKVFILVSILTVASCASLDNLAYLPPNQRSPIPNPLSSQYIPASNQRASGAFGSSSGSLGGTSGSFNFNQNGGGLTSGQRSNGAFGGSSSGNLGGGSGSFSFNQNGGDLALGQSTNQRASGAFEGSNNGFGNSFNQIGQTGFRQSSNQQSLHTSYGGYSGAGHSLGQTDFKKNINQGISESSFGRSAGTTLSQASGIAVRNQANSGYSGHTLSVGSSSGGYAGGSGQAGLRNSESLVPILKLASDNNGDGTYRFSYETANSISAEEQGDARNGGTKAQGSFGYSAPDGQQVSISYTADANGFVPQGSHIPTPPPIPQAILRSIEENAAAAAKGISNDGAYRGEGQNEGQYRGEGLDAAAYNSNVGSGFGGVSGSSAFQNSFGSSGISKFNANGASNGGYKY